MKAKSRIYKTAIGPIMSGDLARNIKIQTIIGNNRDETASQNRWENTIGYENISRICNMGNVNVWWQQDRAE